MVLPLYLAMTAAEISGQPFLPERLAYMACSFSPYSLGLSGIPSSLPEGSMLIVTDRMSCQSHSSDLVAGQLQDAVTRLSCESVLLDFQRPVEPQSEAVVSKIIQAAPCPVAVTEAFAASFSCPVFLSPAPLHVPLPEYLSPWQGREIWLETALCQEDILITSEGCSYIPRFPTDGMQGGFYDETLYCHYSTKTEPNSIRFTLFDTREDLDKKLELAHTYGVTRAVGLWQELHR